MTREKMVLLVTVFAFTTVFGQNKKEVCDCPKTQYAGTKADTTFRLSNGKKIALCGTRNPASKPATYSKFVLAVCGQDSIIDFWNASLTCRLKVNKDTLLVNRLQNLPIGEGFKSKETVWSTDKIYFSGQKAEKKLVVNRNIRKYTKATIQTVLKTYETAKPGIDESKMVLANRLFVAAISGDIKAREYFKQFKTKFGTLDGAFAEEYNDLTSMLALWDKAE